MKKYSNYCVNDLKDMWALCDANFDVWSEQVWSTIDINYCMLGLVCLYDNFMMRIINLKSISIDIILHKECEVDELIYDMQTKPYVRQDLMYD